MLKTSTTRYDDFNSSTTTAGERMFGNKRNKLYIVLQDRSHGFRFRSFLRKLTRHVDAARERPHTAKVSRKGWRKRRANGINEKFWQWLFKTSLQSQIQRFDIQLTHVFPQVRPSGPGRFGSSNVWRSCPPRWSCHLSWSGTSSLPYLKKRHGCWKQGIHHLLLRKSLENPCFFMYIVRDTQ